MMSTERYTQKGFSLIEILIAITILGIIAGISVPMFMGYLDKARIRGTRSNLRSLKSSIEMFKLDTGKYPSKLRDLVQKPREEALARKWQKGGYIEGGELPQDNWGESFQYKVTPGGKNPFELYSFGSNGPGAPKEEWLSVWDRE